MGINADRIGGVASDERFLRLADRELRLAHGLAAYLLGSSSEAEDAVQEAIIRAWRGWPRLRDEERFQPWFERILLNVCRDRAKRRGRLRVVELEPLITLSVSDPFKAMLDRDAIGRALSMLPTDQRAVVVLRFWRDLSLEDIAYRLEVPVGTVKSRLHHGLRALRGTMAGTIAAGGET